MVSKKGLFLICSFAGGYAQLLKADEPSVKDSFKNIGTTWGNSLKGAAEKAGDWFHRDGKPLVSKDGKVLLTDREIGIGAAVAGIGVIAAAGAAAKAFIDKKRNKRLELEQKIWSDPAFVEAIGGEKDDEHAVEYMRADSVLMAKAEVVAVWLEDQDDDNAYELEPKDWSKNNALIQQAIKEAYEPFSKLNPVQQQAVLDEIHDGKDWDSVSKKINKPKN